MRRAAGLLLIIAGSTGLAGCVGAPGAVQQSYGPPPAPPPAGQVPYGGTCYAGIYTCQLPAMGPVGSQCTCPGLGAPSYGYIN